MLAFKVSDELEYIYAHAHTVTVDVFNTIAIKSTSSCREMRLVSGAVHGGRENNLLPSACTTKEMVINCKFAVAVPRYIGCPTENSETMQNQSIPIFSVRSTLGEIETTL